MKFQSLIYLKSVVVISIIIFFSSNLFVAQNRNFDGVWSGIVTRSDGNERELSLYNENNKIFVVRTDDNGEPEMKVKILMEVQIGDVEKHDFWIKSSNN